jgi:hypothetical protein
MIDGPHGVLFYFLSESRSGIATSSYHQLQSAHGWLLSR